MQFVRSSSHDFLKYNIEPSDLKIFPYDYSTIDKVQFYLTVIKLAEKIRLQYLQVSDL